MADVVCTAPTCVDVKHYCPCLRDSARLAFRGRFDPQPSLRCCSKPQRREVAPTRGTTLAELRPATCCSEGLLYRPNDDYNLIDTRAGAP